MSDDGGSRKWVAGEIMVSIPMSLVLVVREGISEFALPLVHCLGQCSLLWGCV